MKKIKHEDIKVGNFIYLSYKDDKEKIFVLKILSRQMDTYYWNITGSKELNLDMFYPKGKYKIEKADWKYYKVYKLNKNEVKKLNKQLILSSL